MPDGFWILNTRPVQSGTRENKFVLYTILFTLFSAIFEINLLFLWRNLPTNSNYFTKIYLLFSVTLIITYNLREMRVTKLPA